MPNLKGMNVEALMSLRNQVDRRLAELRTQLEKQLGAITGQPPAKGGAGSSLKGRKVRRNIVAHQVRLGPEEEQGRSGWLRP
jgi:hypothetical protein